MNTYQKWCELQEEKEYLKRNKTQLKHTEIQHQNNQNVTKRTKT